MNSKYFYCYSINLLRFIRNNGLDSICKGIHPKTNKTFWVFEKDERLDSILKQWK